MAYLRPGFLNVDAIFWLLLALAVISIVAQFLVLSYVAFNE
jgi:hypothetical protein